ncbi:ABC transporter ATP-binding protein [Qipengyuania sp. XHP0207]|uniref:ABC transporter ATP-binding protein n=1 Tax=Qipengyuania sp. XHP0207 TaxID=3038078 RepID=UPI00241E8440|nr:ABC transporter ATP-binding protein [Qipengyuania sp. XHP0207]MDG5747220.1 ABC transporter ATP-binding protein [Qipengyuania sp. XHP0207]
MSLAASALTIDGRLTDASALLERGRITAICGPNGAGKSTLIEALAGLLAPDAGTVTLDRVDLSQLPGRERAKRIGYLPQTHEIAWDVPVRNLVELGRMPHADRNAAPVDAALRALDIAHLAERRAQSLSGGETARVLLARVLAGEPEWILADEPLAALDIAHQLALLAHLRAAATVGKGIVLVLHDLAHAMNHADRVIVLDQGRVAADGLPSEALSAATIETVWKTGVQWIEHDGWRALVTAPRVPSS